MCPLPLSTGDGVEIRKWLSFHLKLWCFDEKHTSVTRYKTNLEYSFFQTEASKYKSAKVLLCILLFYCPYSVDVAVCFGYNNNTKQLFYSILSHNLGRSSGHHRWICNNPFPSWPVLSCPSWAGKVHSCPLFDIVFPPLLLSASFSFSFHCAL